MAREIDPAGNETEKFLTYKRVHFCGSGVPLLMCLWLHESTNHTGKSINSSVWNA
jgi:hypothetical protein